MTQQQEITPSRLAGLSDDRASLPLDHAGETVKLDDLLGPGFALIAQDSAGAAALAALDADSFAGLPLGRVFLPFRDATGDLAPATPRDDHARPLRTHRDEILLIRPDRYTAAAFAPDNLQQGLADYGRVLGL